jgi:uncharacterized membrane-anchored protein
MVALMAAVHAWAPADAKTLSLASIVFTGLLAGVTCLVHCSILTLSRANRSSPTSRGWVWSSRSSGPRSRTPSTS